MTLVFLLNKVNRGEGRGIRLQDGELNIEIMYRIEIEIKYLFEVKVEILRMIVILDQMGD